MKIRCPSTARTRIFDKSKQWWSITSSDLVRHQSKNLPKHYEVLFTGSEIPLGPAELSQVQRDKRKLGTMCHALIAEHMFTPNLDTYTGDDAIIDTFTREDSARASRANASRADKMTFDRKKAEWKRHLATVCSTLSKIFLWFIREVSASEIQQDFEQVFRSHILLPQYQYYTMPSHSLKTLSYYSRCIIL